LSIVAGYAVILSWIFDAVQSSQIERGTGPACNQATLNKGKISNWDISPRRVTTSSYTALATAGAAWCLWCLFEAEIGAIYAEALKELKQATP